MRVLLTLLFFTALAFIFALIGATVIAGIWGFMAFLWSVSGR